MIAVDAVLNAVPHFETFCSVEKLHALVESLRGDPRFDIQIAGMSVNGLPIHHVRCGHGRLKALFVGFPHCDEPIGGLTTYSLLTLLHEGSGALAAADVEWHVVPCVDPDGAKLNEGWSQKKFALDAYMRNFHKQELSDQVDCSFPLRHKRLVFERPVKEAVILQRLLTTIRPDFYYSLHNAWAGGAFYFLTRQIDRKYYGQLYALLQAHRIPLQTSPPHRVWCERFAEGVYEIVTTKKIYDVVERSGADPQDILKTGACSWEYLAEIKPDALTFVAELPYVRHSSDGSQERHSENLRQLKLRIDADNKFLATVILEEWDKVKEDLDVSSPFYRKVTEGVISARDRLSEGLPSWGRKTRDLLFNPAYGETMTEGERFNTYLFDRFYVLCHSYEFVRLLGASTQTPAVSRAIERLEGLFDAALEDIAKHVDFDRFETIDCNALARVQLGSGLTVLNAMLEHAVPRNENDAGCGHI